MKGERTSSCVEGGGGCLGDVSSEYSFQKDLEKKKSVFSFLSKNDNASCKVTK